MISTLVLLSIWMAASEDIAAQPLPDAARPFVELHEFTSPLTNESFSAYILRKDPPVASYDYDRCPHPPFNVYAYTLVIDPATGYVEYPELFGKSCKWDAAGLADVLGEPQFARNSPPGLPWAGAHPWEKYENAAKLAQAAGLPSLTVANLRLLAAWSVRLDVIGGGNEFDAEVEAVFSRLPKRSPDASDLITLYEMQLAAYWEELRNSGQLSDVDDSDLTLALAWLYRSRGELVPAEKWLSLAALANPAIRDQAGSLYNYLASSIDLERTYLMQSRDLMTDAWNKGEVSRVQEAGVAYLLGEIERRLGNYPRASYWYDQAERKNLGALSTDLIKRQRQIVDSGQGY